MPIATFGIGRLRLTISGGNYLRQLPHGVLRRAIAWQTRRQVTPLVFYLMPWELDANQPRLHALPPMSRLRHYRNLAKSRWAFEDYFERYAFGTVADYLGLETQEKPVTSTAASSARRA